MISQGKSEIFSCRSCNSKKLIEVLSLGNLYLSDFTNYSQKPPRYPLTLVLCRKCYLVQLKHTTPATLLYTENYGYKSGINNTMRNELKEIATKAINAFLGKKKNIAVDIGANDGTLLSFYPKSYIRIGVEPIKKFAKECKKYATHVINNYFNAKNYKKIMGNKKATIITAISCFYDINNPNEFISDVAQILDENGIFIIQQNYLVEMLKKNAFDNIVHEHLEYYSLLSLENLLNKHNLEVFDVEVRNINGGSFRTYISFKGKRRITKRVLDLKKEEVKMRLDKIKIYSDFAKRVFENKKKLLSFIKKQAETGKKVYIYGASTRGNTLMQYCKLNRKLIPYAVERNPEKWGKKIASVDIPIISEEKARRQKPDYMLVLPWFFKDEFLKRERTYLDSGGHFILPLPEMEII